MKQRFVGGLAVVWAVAMATPVRASELTWDAQPGCEDQQEARAAIERIIKRPLDEVEGIDFAVQVTTSGPTDSPTGWQARIQTFVAGELQGEQVIEAALCEEVREAVAVAMSMVIIDAKKDQDAQASSGDSNAGAGEAPWQTGPAPVSDVDTDPPPHTFEEPKPPWAATVSAGGVLDVGLMPKAALGGQVGVQVRYLALGVRLYGAAFGSQRVALNNGSAGDFMMILSGVLACTQPELHPIRLQGCAGFEEARVNAVGISSADARAFRQTQWFGSLRAELAAGLPIVSNFSLWLRAGASVPLSHPNFVTNDVRTVDRVNTLAARVALEGEVQF